MSLPSFRESGRKTALRLILHTLRQSDESVDQFVDAISLEKGGEVLQGVS